MPYVDAYQGHRKQLESGEARCSPRKILNFRSSKIEFWAILQLKFDNSYVALSFKCKLGYYVADYVNLNTELNG